MDSAIGLIILAGVMLIGSFLAGSIPIVMNMSNDKMHFISVMGAGLLVGTALIVIIPEGIHTLYFAQLQKEKNRNPTVLLSNVLPLPSTSTNDNHDSHNHPQASSYSENEGDPFGSVGLALILGFCLMLVVDQCSRAISVSSRGDVESSSSPHKRTFTATLGLVVHAAVDGIALGAAATTSHSDVEMIVFVAIMLHKAPAAFGLVTFLLHEGLDRNAVRRHLAIFALAAPVMAIVTYFGISQEGKETISTMDATATAMLFSGGTFLYVATVHVLPEVTKDSQNGFSRKELIALVGGALLPLLLTSGHHH